VFETIGKDGQMGTRKFQGKARFYTSMRFPLPTDKTIKDVQSEEVDLILDVVPGDILGSVDPAKIDLSSGVEYGVHITTSGAVGVAVAQERDGTIWLKFTKLFGTLHPMQEVK
jgi:hypothetical protein